MSAPPHRLDRRLGEHEERREGEFLPEDVYEDWTSAPRDEARTRFVTAARSLAARLGESGDHRRTAEVARRLVAADRYDDDAHRLLIDSLVAAGEPGEAQRAHAAYATAMADLDIEVETFTRR